MVFSVEMTTESKITAADIQQGLPTPIRAFLLVDSAELPESMRPIVKAFWEAAQLIQDTARVEQSVNVIFSTAPFSLNISTGKLVYTPREDVINAYVNNVIFLDCNKLAKVPYEFMVVAILEELVHVVMRVKDEDTASTIVDILYSGIEYTDGKFVLPDPPDEI